MASDSSFESFGSIDCSHPLVILNPFEYTEQQDSMEINEEVNQNNTKFGKMNDFQE